MYISARVTMASGSTTQWAFTSNFPGSSVLNMHTRSPDVCFPIPSIRKTVNILRNARVAPIPRRFKILGLWCLRKGTASKSRNGMKVRRSIALMPSVSVNSTPHRAVRKSMEAIVLFMCATSSPTVPKTYSNKIHINIY